MIRCSVQLHKKNVGVGVVGVLRVTRKVKDSKINKTKGHIWPLDSFSLQTQKNNTVVLIFKNVFIHKSDVYHCIYIYMYIHDGLYKHMRLYINIYICMFVYMNALMYVYI